MVGFDSLSLHVIFLISPRVRTNERDYIMSREEKEKEEEKGAGDNEGRL